MDILIPMERDFKSSKGFFTYLRDLGLAHDGLLLVAGVGLVDRDGLLELHRGLRALLLDLGLDAAVVDLGVLDGAGGGLDLGLLRLLLGAHVVVLDRLVPCVEAVDRDRDILKTTLCNTKSVFKITPSPTPACATRRGRSRRP